MSSKPERWIRWTLLLGVLLAGWLLRAKDLELYRMSPDEGNYLYSAGVQRLERDVGPVRGLEEDLSWLVPRYYPHSYLHQLATRWAWRLTGNAVRSVRIDSAVLGLLTAVVVWLLTRRVLPRSEWAAVAAAAIVALQCLHVWYARTGWGQTGCTFFFAVYLTLGWEFVRRERSFAGDAALAAGMAVSALLAYGWHEMIVVHVGGMGLFLLLHHVLGGPGFEGRGLAALPRTLMRSRKAWLALASALPMVVLLGLLLFHPFFRPFARQHWIDFEEEHRHGVLAVLDFLFTGTHVERQVSIPVLVLAAVGWFGLRRRDRLASRYLATAAVTSSLLFVFLFKDANLVRIYLPTAVVLAILAGIGLVTVCERAPEHLRPAALGAATAALALWMGAVSFRTIHDWKDGTERFFVPSFHRVAGFELVDARDVHAVPFALLRERLRPGETVGVEAIEKHGRNAAGEFSILFRLRDAGFSAAPFAFDLPPGRWPRFLMGVKRGMEQRGRTVETGGAYREIGADRFGRIALYELASPPEQAAPGGGGR